MTRNISPETRAAIQRLLRKRAELAGAIDRMTLSAWAEEHFELDADSSHKVGAWVCWSFQVGLMDWMSDDRVERVNIKKSKRVGYTKILTALICYYVEHLRRKVALWQPTDDDRDSYVRTELEPVLDLVEAVKAARRKGGALDTLKLKQFIGAVLHLLGGKAARAYRRITVALAILDEWSAFDQSIEGQGDPGSLAFGRLEGAPFPKFVGGSTPGTRGACHVTLACEQSHVDMRYHIVCPHCGVEHPLLTGIAPDGTRTKAGLQWQPGKPETVVHICPHCLEPITQSQYLVGGEPMQGTWVCIRTGIRYLGAGRWTGAAGDEIRPPRIVGAQIWSAYSPQRTWSSIAEDHERAASAAEAGDNSLMITLVNETYGEAWEVIGQRRDEHALERQANKHRLSIVPVGALVLTAGIDVQQDRIEIGVWGWARGLESWVIDHHIIEGNPSVDEDLWTNAALYLQRRYRQAWNWGTLGIESISIDSGYATHAVYNFVRQHAGILNIRAIKGDDDVKMPVKGPAKAVEVNWRGQRWPNGVKLWHIGTQAAEDLLHGQLGVEKPGPGYLHYAEGLPTEWYAQLTGKTRVPVRSNRGVVDRWIRMRKRVEVRDCRRYAHHAAECMGLSGYTAEHWRQLEERVQPPQDLFSEPIVISVEDDASLIPTAAPVVPAAPAVPMPARLNPGRAAGRIQPRPFGG